MKVAHLISFWLLLINLYSSDGHGVNPWVFMQPKSRPSQVIKTTDMNQPKVSEAIKKEVSESADTQHQLVNLSKCLKMSNWFLLWHFYQCDGTALQWKISQAAKTMKKFKHRIQ